MTNQQLKVFVKAVSRLLGRATPCLEQNAAGEFPLAYVTCEDFNAVREASRPFDHLLSDISYPPAFPDQTKIQSRGVSE